MQKDTRFVEMRADLRDPVGWLDPEGKLHETEEHGHWIKEFYGFESGDNSPTANSLYDRAVVEGWIRISPSFVEMGRPPSDALFRRLQELFASHPKNFELLFDDGGNEDYFRVPASALQTSKSYGAMKRFGVKESKGTDCRYRPLREHTGNQRSIHYTDNTSVSESKGA